MTEKTRLVVPLTENVLQDFLYLCNGVFAPLNGFMASMDFRSVVDAYCLAGGQVFPIPITLDVSQQVFEQARQGDLLLLSYQGETVGELTVEDGFLVTEADVQKIYGTLDPSHPGVSEESKRSPYRMGGQVCLVATKLLRDALSPEITKQAFHEKGLRTVVGFQTRNPIHRAHEYLQRCALEICDGLFINPIVGWKKAGDFTEAAVMAAYEKMIELFFQPSRVYIHGLKTQMRYAGPREAVFHAILRRNLGCTHFIIGRDHAGVGHFYGDYAAHDLAKELMAKYDLGISLFLFREPYYCNICGQVVTEKTCCHTKEDRMSISGTKIRQCLAGGILPDTRMMRKEISEAILSVGHKNLFIER